MNRQRPEFIIYAPGFDDSKGGFIALHLLCDRLNRLNFKAALWPLDKPSFSWRSPRRYLKYYLKRQWRNFPRGPFKGPLVINARYIKKAVVLYPEGVWGNPLGAPKVARWFLHKPGFHTGEINYGDGEIYFFYNEAFNDKAINPDAENLLRVTYFNPIYKRTNFGSRRGSCYLIRKGHKRILDQHPSDAIPIDNLSHQEKASLFNEMEYLYSYDPYTFYVVYAAICGCVPIIIPEDGISKEDWQPIAQLRLGLAYGAAEIELAKQQQGNLLARLNATRQNEDQMVCRFVQKCRSHFGTQA